MRISDWSSDVCSSDLTAWLKAHHAPEFYAASMSFDMALTDKLSVFVDDMRRLGVACLAPDLNASEASFSVEPHEDGYAVRYALAALKGVGERAMEELVAERRADGPLTRSEEHTSELQSLMRSSYAVFCLKNKKSTQAIQLPKTNQQKHKTNNKN